MAAGDTQITIVGQPRRRSGAAIHTRRTAGGAVPHRVHAEVPRQRQRRVEGRRQSLPDLQCLAAGGRERGREPAARACASLSRDGCGSGHTRPRKARSAPSDEVEVDDVCPSLRNASARVNKVARSGGGFGGQGGQAVRAVRAPEVAAAAVRRAAARVTAAAAAVPRPTRGPATAAATRRAAVLAARPARPCHPCTSAPNSRPFRLGRGSAKEHHDGQATDTQAEEEGCVLAARSGSPTSTTRTRACSASTSPTGARSGPGGSRQLHPAPARCRHRDQECP